MLPEVKAVVFIPLTQGKVAVIDFDDFEKVRGFKWRLLKCGRRFYARTRQPGSGQPGKTLFMHRVILDAPANLDVDHRDGDGLNNQRNNIRLCSPAQNARGFQKKRRNTTSQYRGAFWDKHQSLWYARIEKAGEKFRFGGFRNEEDAARAYDAKARELFGEWASPNFPT